MSETIIKPKSHGLMFHSDLIAPLMNCKVGTWSVEPINENRPAKWQTRRTVKPQPDEQWSIPPAKFYDGYFNRWGCQRDDESIKCPHSPGTEIWVKETWGSAWMTDKEAREAIESGEGETLFYRADWPDKNVQPSLAGRGWRSSMLMPRIASRLSFVVKEVRVQRVQDISEGDAAAEGFATHADYRAYIAFKAKWIEINGEESWKQNPWVWCYSLMRIK